MVPRNRKYADSPAMGGGEPKQRQATNKSYEYARVRNIAKLKGEGRKGKSNVYTKTC